MTFQDLSFPDWKSREETRRSTAKDFQNPLSLRKRKNRFKEEDVDIALNTWLGQKNDQNARINGPILKLKAQQLAEEMGHDFTPSDGWLSRLCLLRTQARFGIKHAYALSR